MIISAHCLSGMPAHAQAGSTDSFGAVLWHNQYYQQGNQLLPA